MGVPAILAEYIHSDQTSLFGWDHLVVKIQAPSAQYGRFGWRLGRRLSENRLICCERDILAGLPPALFSRDNVE